MKTQTAKAKGRRLQQHVRDMLLGAFPTLQKDDIVSTSMGAAGEDLMLSPAARKQIPYSFECKARKRFDTLYGYMDQAESNAGEHIPVAVLKGDRKQPLVILKMEDFLGLIR